MMPRMFFNVHECGTVIADDEGMDVPDLHAARKIAIAGARDLMCGEISRGRLCLGCAVHVTDQSGAELLKVPFREAVEISGI